MISEKRRQSLVNAWKNRSDYHGMYYTKFYNCWRSMITRCNGTCGEDSKKKYRDKGIRVCYRWKTFTNFMDDMYESYEEGLTIDRIDNSLGYFKGNCRWATMQEQQNNRTNNTYIKYRGKSQTMRQWSDELNIPYNKIKNRYYNMYAKGKCTVDRLMIF